MSFMANIYNNYSLMVRIYALYLFGINLLTFLLMGVDKMKARKGQWRIKEITFILMALLGGGIGVLMGMVFYHHKQSKKKFYIGVPLIYVINKIVSILIYNYLIFAK